MQMLTGSIGPQQLFPGARSAATVQGILHVRDETLQKINTPTGRSQSHSDNFLIRFRFHGVNYLVQPLHARTEAYDVEALAGLLAKVKTGRG